MSRLLLCLAPIAVLLFSTAGCGGSSDAPTVVTPSPVSPAPAVLQGVWVATSAVNGELVTLTLAATTYRITRGAIRADGVIAVAGERIEFSRSNLCDGTGAYRWTVTGTSLLLNVIGSDACPGRSDELAGYTYVKSG